MISVAPTPKSENSQSLSPLRGAGYQGCHRDAKRLTGAVCCSCPTTSSKQTGDQYYYANPFTSIIPVCRMRADDIIVEPPSWRARPSRPPPSKPRPPQPSAAAPPPRAVVQNAAPYGMPPCAADAPHWARPQEHFTSSVVTVLIRVLRYLHGD